MLFRYSPCLSTKRVNYSQNQEFKRQILQGNIIWQDKKQPMPQNNLILILLTPPQKIIIIITIIIWIIIITRKPTKTKPEMNYLMGSSQFFREKKKIKAFKKLLISKKQKEQASKPACQRRLFLYFAFSVSLGILYFVIQHGSQFFFFFFFFLFFFLLFTLWFDDHLLPHK